MKKILKKFTLDNLNIQSVDTCGGGGTNGTHPVFNQRGNAANNGVYAPNSEGGGGGGGGGGNAGGNTNTDNCEAPTQYHPTECYTYNDTTMCNRGLTYSAMDLGCHAIYTVTNNACPNGGGVPVASVNDYNCDVESQDLSDGCNPIPKTFDDGENCIVKTNGARLSEKQCAFLYTIKPVEDLDCDPYVISIEPFCDHG